MNTCLPSPERARASQLASWWVAATDGCPVSLFLCARQAPFLPRIADGMAFAQAGPFQFNPMSAVDDAIQDGIADRQIAHEFMPARHRNLAGYQQ